MNTASQQVELVKLLADLEEEAVLALTIRFAVTWTRTIGWPMR